ncbi:TPA: CBS domain-containing protein [Legionella pneumophila]|uniref:CBS domain-containing protein n=1 Tax=Legionella pneumophila TaxID=446 RepID=A0A2S6EWB3_LEGPN|nr:CBS domain-containing protein [Legionella pneumophila]APF04138.1 histidine kinase [Legionella pneumophila subsp. fraseri]APF07121.1 histidine kinase [Legionella pneumophila subsp. fraseri]AUB69576.1 histidine kinase [Legionella pneumophila]AUB72551.1 histidine kinase [Legionella pneumophila]KXB24412.1 histidine kinase [Legionella pneumophila]
MRIGEFCNRDVVMMNGDESVKQAAELMRAHHVGDIVLVEELKRRRVPIGIVTDRDLVVEVMALDVNPEELAVQDIVTRSVLLAREEDSLIDSLALMQEKGVRRLPVVDNDDELVGIITIDDITELLAEMLHKVVGVVDRQQKVEKQQRS